MWRPGLTAAASEEGTVWLDATGRPNANARDALRLLADTAADGLATRNYQATNLAERVARLDAAPSTATSPQPAFERSLDSAMQRYLHGTPLTQLFGRALASRRVIASL